MQKENFLEGYDKRHLLVKELEQNHNMYFRIIG